MKVALRSSILEAVQFLPALQQIPKGISDVYQMDENTYTGAVWVQGKRRGIVAGDWVLYDRHGIIQDVVKPHGFADYIKVQIEAP